MDTFIPNDVCIRGGMGLDVFPAGADEMSDGVPELGNAMSVLVLTGANACGKVLSNYSLLSYRCLFFFFLLSRAST